MQYSFLDTCNYLVFLDVMKYLWKISLKFILFWKLRTCRDLERWYRFVTKPNTTSSLIGGKRGQNLRVFMAHDFPRCRLPQEKGEDTNTYCKQALWMDILQKFWPSRERMEQSKAAAASLSRLIQQQEESSQKHQLQCFFNHVLLGQWELARSTSRMICQNPLREDRRYVLNALIDIASNPYEQRLV